MPEKKSYLPVTHVIFDLDGLLINSEVLFANAIDVLLKRYGLYSIYYYFLEIITKEKSLIHFIQNKSHDHFTKHIAPG